MKRFLIILLGVSTIIPVSGKEIEINPAFPCQKTAPLIGNLSLAFVGKNQSELQWDDGISTTSYFHSAFKPYATTFTAPAGCHLIGYKFYWYNGGNQNVDCYLYADDGGGPPYIPYGTTAFTITQNFGIVSGEWVNVDLSGEGTIFDAGEIFHPGWSWSGTGEYGLYLDSAVEGSYACWITIHGNWFDYSYNYSHMMRVVINDDIKGPYADEKNPGDGEHGVPLRSNITFRVKDSDMGVVSSSINNDSVIVYDNTKTEITGTLTVDPTNPNDVGVIFDPDNDFGEAVEVTVTVSPPGYEITDVLGNTMNEDSWTFMTYPSAIKSASLGEIKASFAGPGYLPGR